MSRLKVPDAACTNQVFMPTEVQVWNSCPWVQLCTACADGILWLWGVTLSTPVVVTAPGFVQERELAFVPSRLRHILRGVDAFGSFHGLSSFWHVTLGCALQFQGPSWDLFDENMDAPSSKHGSSELNVSPQALSMICREKKALLACALCHPPVGISQRGQRVALSKCWFLL